MLLPKVASRPNLVQDVKVATAQRDVRWCNDIIPELSVNRTHGPCKASFYPFCLISHCDHVSYRPESNGMAKAFAKIFKRDCK